MPKRIRTKLAGRRGKRVRSTMWDDSFEGWTVKFLHREFWRLEPIMEWEDAMQEMKVVFCHIRKKYEGCNDGPKHVMALYKVACHHWVNTLSTRASKRRSGEVLYATEQAMEVAASTVSGDLDNEGSVLFMLSKLPEDVRETLRILYDAPAEVLDLVCSSIRTGKRHHAANRKLCEVAGEDPESVNLINGLRTCFLERED